MNIGERSISFRIILLGDSGVGKTNIIQRYLTNEFKNEYHVTICSDFDSKEVQISEKERINIQIWDTAGQECFRSIITSFYKNAAAIFLVFDLTSRDSFQSLETWFSELLKSAKKDVIVTLLANKCDLDEQFMLKSEIKEFVEKNKLNSYFITSALDGSNIDKAFVHVSKEIYNTHNANYRKNSISESIYLNQNPRNIYDSKDQTISKEKKGCC